MGFKCMHFAQPTAPDAQRFYCASNAGRSRCWSWLAKNPLSVLIDLAIKFRIVDANIGRRSASYESNRCSPPDPCSVAASFHPRLRASSRPEFTP